MTYPLETATTKGVYHKYDKIREYPLQLHACPTAELYVAVGLGEHVMRWGGWSRRQGLVTGVPQRESRHQQTSVLLLFSGRGPAELPDTQCLIKGGKGGGPFLQNDLSLPNEHLSNPDILLLGTPLQRPCIPWMPTWSSSGSS